jgi:hypothetical protein
LHAVLLLADWAQAINGKLYIQGAGWSRVIVPPTGEIAFAIAAKLDVDWDETNQPHDVTVALVDADGRPVVNDAGQPVIDVRTQLEVGRPVGLAPGTPIDVPLAVNVQHVRLRTGRYDVVLSSDGEHLARAAFDVVAG